MANRVPKKGAEFELNQNHLEGFWWKICIRTISRGWNIPKTSPNRCDSALIQSLLLRIFGLIAQPLSMLTNLDCNPAEAEDDWAHEDWAVRAADHPPVALPRHHALRIPDHHQATPRPRLVQCSSVWLNVVKGWVISSRANATFDQVYLDSRILVRLWGY